MAWSFTIWKTIKLGTYQTTDEYREALKKLGCRISNWADGILGIRRSPVPPLPALHDLGYR